MSGRGNPLTFFDVNILPKPLWIVQIRPSTGTLHGSVDPSWGNPKRYLDHRRL